MVSPFLKNISSTVKVYVVVGKKDFISTNVKKQGSDSDLDLEETLLLKNELESYIYTY